MGSRELSEWMAYERLEPFGETRADLRAGIISSITANVHRTSNDDPITKPADFMPRFWEEETPEPTPEEISNQLRTAFLKYC